eukprot:CAMPEP_0116937888 /NCGR_PEP_ID=MMETSP0467-20121206/31770_1 /TAXON_ID=283647 /ORGANISM="Mesodinium pulex, Strain SPMC105" /LENGTH=89 /DNA_ID=CAMNT_0004619785 /DNA_START=165 /DNA_END=434 /DNA_ORIENTATION=+
MTECSVMSIPECDILDLDQDEEGFVPYVHKKHRKTSKPSAEEIGNLKLNIEINPHILETKDVAWQSQYEISKRYKVKKKSKSSNYKKRK